MINEIRLVNLLPNVFAGDSSRANSELWLGDVSLRKGERYLIEAASGTGKTSLCSFIMGMRGDYKGRILFDGNDTRSFSKGHWSALRRRALAWLPQELGLFPDLTLEQNIAIKNGLTNHYETSQIKEMARKLGIDNKWDVKARFLSIGQQQRAAFIRMLCQPADFFLLDEAVSHLDKENQHIMAEMLVEAADILGAGIIITSVGNRLNIDRLTTLKL